ncbi:MAG: hypothetical protein JXA07_15070 [Spirochaetes bacterium]|nr:hypothetical protein [Spirochaetota bacterium]
MKQSRWFYCCLSVIVLLTARPIFLAAAPVDIERILKDRSMCPHASYLEDRNGLLTIGEVWGEEQARLWKQTDKKTLGFGFTSSVYWVRFDIRNRGPRDVDILIQQEYPLIDELEMRVYSDSRPVEKYRTGDLLPFDSRPYRNRTFVFPVKVKAGAETLIYLRYKSQSSMNIVLSAWRPAEFSEISREEELILMIYYGIMLSMVIYNLFVLIFLRKTEYLYYTIFIFGFLIFTMTQNGTAFQFLWPSFPWFANFCIPPVLCLTVLSVILFSVGYLDMKMFDRIFYWILIVFAGALGLFFVATLFLPYRLSMTGSAGLSLVVVVTAITAGIRVALKGNRNARLYLLACGLFMLGSLVYLLMTFGLLPSGVVTKWSLQAGSAAMVLLLSLALAERIRTTTVQLGSMKTRLERRTRSLEEIVASARQLSSELSRIGSDQERISRTFSDMSQEQASMSEQMSAAFEELTAAIDTIRTAGERQVAERDRVNDMVRELRSTQETVTAMSGDALKSVGEISGFSDETGANMDRMAEVIRVIAEGGRTVRNFMSVIDDITDRINLLSLNASIEAARAGEAGRGFAVVADEIGKLATATVDNSKEISGQIGSIISDIESSLKIMEDTRGSIEKIFSGVRLIGGKVESVAREMESLGRVMNTIVDQAVMLDDMSKSIALSTSEHKLSMDESAKMVLRISEMASAMARSTGDIVQFAGMMLERARELDSIIRENEEEEFPI